MATSKKTKSKAPNKKKSQPSLAEAAAHAEKVTSTIHAAIARGLPSGTGMKLMKAPPPSAGAAGGPDPWEPKIYVTISAVYQVYPPPEE